MGPQAYSRIYITSSQAQLHSRFLLTHSWQRYRQKSSVKTKWVAHIPNLSRLVIRSEGTKESRSASKIPSGSNWATWWPRICKDKVAVRPDWTEEERKLWRDGDSGKRQRKEWGSARGSQYERMNKLSVMGRHLCKRNPTEHTPMYTDTHAHVAYAQFPTRFGAKWE